jgi:hypothetical protein
MPHAPVGAKTKGIKNPLSNLAIYWSYISTHGAKSVGVSLSCSSPDVGGRISLRNVVILTVAAARFQSQARSCGICGGQSGTGVCFLQVLRFLLLLFILPNAAYTSIILGEYNRPIGGRSTRWTQSHRNPRNNNKKIKLYCDMTPERWKCAETSIARQRLYKYVSVATDRLVETKTLLRN